MKAVFITMFAILGFSGFALGGVVTDNLYGYFHAADSASFSPEHYIWRNVAGLYGGIAPNGLTGIDNLYMNTRPPIYIASEQSFSFHNDYFASSSFGLIGEQGTRNTYSVEFWLNPRTIGMILSADTFKLELKNGNTTNCALSYFLYQYNNPPIVIDTDQVITLNRWHHVVFTCDGATCKTYVDGQHITSGDMTNPNAYFTLRSISPTRLGESGFYNGFDGSMKVFRYYDDALTAEEVLDNFNYGMTTGVPEPATNLLLLGGLTMLRKLHIKSE